MYIFNWGVSSTLQTYCSNILAVSIDPYVSETRSHIQTRDGNTVCVSNTLHYRCANMYSCLTIGQIIYTGNV